MTVRFRRAKKWPLEQPRVLYLTNRDVLHPMAQFATWHLNGVCIPVSSSSTTNELEYVIKNSEADLVVCHSSFLDRFQPIEDEVGIPIYHLNDSDVDL